MVKAFENKNKTADKQDNEYESKERKISDNTRRIKNKRGILYRKKSKRKQAKINLLKNPNKLKMKIFRKIYNEGCFIRDQS